MKNLLHEGDLYWKDIKYHIELYESDSIEGLNPITQVQAVLFVDENTVVLYKHIDGYYGLPGGKPEQGESFEQALKREIKEESACEMLDCGFMGYMKNTREDGEITYQLRYWALVQSLDEPVNDPCGKAIDREIMNIEDAIQKLNWEDRGEILLHVAQKKFKEKKSIVQKPSNTPVF